MKTIGEVLKLSTTYLAERSIERARRLGEEAVAFCVGLKRLELYMQFDRPVVESELEALRPMLKRLSAHEPLEYVLGTLEFAGCTLAVNRSVLIPRPETEILVSLLIKRLEGVSLAGKILWDVCCGSGCIGLALKKRFPELCVILADVSGDALRLAEQNAKAGGLEVELLQGDFLAPFGQSAADILVCNPPYLSTSEYLICPASVRDFEPKLALVAGERGTEFYERLARERPANALLALEIGATQGAAVQRIFEGEGKVVQDWSGKDRFFFLEPQTFSPVECPPICLVPSRKNSSSSFKD